MRLIDADALKAALRTNNGAKVLGHSVHRLFCMDSMIDELPTIDAVPVVHGEWGQPNRFKDGVGLWRCDQCGEASIRRFRHCPECGAKMDGDENG